MDADRTLDTSGLNCPLPILKAKKEIALMSAGASLHVIATDPGSMPDFRTFARQTGHELARAEEREGKFHFVLIKAH